MKEKIISVTNEGKVLGTGIHTFSVYNCLSEQALKIVESIELITKKRNELFNAGLLTRELSTQLHNEYRKGISLLDHFKVRETVVHNTIVDIGLYEMASRLCGENNSSFNINYAAIGTDPTPVTDSDTLLGTEIYRKVLGVGSRVDNKAILETFFNPTEVTGSFREFGTFIDGSDLPNTGILFNRWNDVVNKTSSESINLLSEITFNRA